MLTPLQINLAGYMASNSGLGANANLVTYTNSYKSVSTVAGFNGLLANASSAVSGGTISSSTYTALTNINSAFKPLIDQDPNGSNNRFISNIVTTHVTQIMSADYTKFVTIFNQVRSHADSINFFIDHKLTANTLFGNTFVSVDSMTMAGFNHVSSNLTALSTDLLLAGNAVNLKYLDRLGYPSLIIVTLKELANGYVGFTDELLIQEIAQADIDAIGQPNYTPTMTVEKQIFSAMKLVTGNKLKDILSVLGCTTKNITSLDQVLDLVKMLPNSFSTLLAPTAKGNANIYQASTAVVNQAFSKKAVDLGIATTANLADTNRAFATSLKQVHSINGKTTSDIANAISTLHTTADLSQITAMTKAIPATTTSNYSANVATGTGANGRILISDVIGSAAGYGFNPELPKFLSNVNTIVNSGVASVLTQSTTGVYDVMNHCLSGVFGTAPCNLKSVLGMSLPSWITGNGYYANINVAFSDLITLAQGQVTTINNSITSSYPTQKSVAAAAWANMGNKITSENSFLQSSGVDLPNVSSSSSSSTMLWVQTISDIAQDTKAGGANEFLERTANTSALSGQIVIATLREARNITTLQDLGVPPVHQISV